MVEERTHRDDPAPKRPRGVVRSRPARTGAVLVVAAGLVVLARIVAGDGGGPLGEAATDAPGTSSPGSGAPGAGTEPREGTTTSTTGESAVSLEALELSVESVEVRSPGGAMEELPGRARRRILRTVESYVREASLRPLTAPAARQRSGDSGGEDLAGLFTGAVRSRLSGPDRATLVDEGVGVAVRGVSVERATVRLSVLGDGDGTPRLATVALDEHLVAHTVDGPVLISRTGELLLVPDDDRWLIDGYRLNVERELGGDAAARSGI